MNGIQLNMILKRIYEIEDRAQEIGNICIDALGAENESKMGKKIHEDLRALLVNNYNLKTVFEEMDK